MIQISQRTPFLGGRDFPPDLLYFALYQAVKGAFKSVFDKWKSYIGLKNSSKKETAEMLTGTFRVIGQNVLVINPSHDWD